MNTRATISIILGWLEIVPCSLTGHNTGTELAKNLGRKHTAGQNFSVILTSSCMIVSDFYVIILSGIG